MDSDKHSRSVNNAGRVKNIKSQRGCRWKGHVIRRNKTSRRYVLRHSRCDIIRRTKSTAEIYTIAASSHVRQARHILAVPRRDGASAVEVDPCLGNASGRVCGAACGGAEVIYADRGQWSAPLAGDDDGNDANINSVLCRSSRSYSTRSCR